MRIIVLTMSAITLGTYIFLLVMCFKIIGVSLNNYKLEVKNKSFLELWVQSLGLGIALSISALVVLIGLGFIPLWRDLNLPYVGIITAMDTCFSSGNHGMEFVSWIFVVPQPITAVITIWNLMRRL